MWFQGLRHFCASAEAAGRSVTPKCIPEPQAWPSRSPRWRMTEVWKLQQVNSNEGRHRRKWEANSGGQGAELPHHCKMHRVKEDYDCSMWLSHCIYLKLSTSPGNPLHGHPRSLDMRSSSFRPAQKYTSKRGWGWGRGRKESRSGYIMSDQTKKSLN